MTPAAWQAFKDPMHGNEHCNSKCTVRAIRDHEVELGLRPDTLVARMKARLHGLCDSPHVQHITLLTLGNQKILEGWDTLNKEMKTKKKVRSQPIVDANDVAKLLLALVFVLEGLGQPEREAHNRRQARPTESATHSRPSSGPSTRTCTRTTCTGPRPCACPKSSGSTP
jgi:hypothetical protein